MESTTSTYSSTSKSFPTSKLPSDSYSTIISLEDLSKPILRNYKGIGIVTDGKYIPKDYSIRIFGDHIINPKLHIIIGKDCDNQYLIECGNREQRRDFRTYMRNHDLTLSLGNYDTNIFGGVKFELFEKLSYISPINPDTHIYEIMSNHMINYPNYTLKLQQINDPDFKFGEGPGVGEGEIIICKIYVIANILSDIQLVDPKKVLNYFSFTKTFKIDRELISSEDIIGKIIFSYGGKSLTTYNNKQIYIKNDINNKIYKAKYFTECWGGERCYKINVRYGSGRRIY